MLSSKRTYQSLRQRGFDIIPCNRTERCIFNFSTYQISGWQFSRVLIGSRNLQYPWVFTVLRTERKMARRFAKVSEEEIEEWFFLSI